MTMFLKHFNIYLHTGLEVSKFLIFFPFTAESMVYNMTLFTVEHKKFRIRHSLMYVKM
jgi:hypothetical protein